MFYLKLWREEIKFSNDETLANKLTRIEKRLSLDGKEAKDRTLILELRKEVYGELDLENSPYDFQIEALKIDLGISSNDWNNLSNEDRGKILATKSIQADFETVAKFESTIRANNKKKNNASSKS